jgi:hypothetical protein
MFCGHLDRRTKVGRYVIWIGQTVSNTHTHTHTHTHTIFLSIKVWLSKSGLHGENGGKFAVTQKMCVL